MPTTYAIPDGRTVMAATTYTGTGATASISNSNNGVSFQPDWVWVKQRNGTAYHALFDSVRGATKVIQSNTTTAEQTFATALTAFNSDGFTTGSSTDTNQSGQSYIGWQWKAGTTSASNTNGSITSTVSANTTAGFSVVTYTGTGANATIGHGLGVAPSMVIVKRRTGAATDWLVYQSSMAATPQNGYLSLNGTAGYTAYAAAWNNTAPTSTVVSIGSDVAVNGSTSTYVAYCFAAVTGYSAFGSYTGNGSTDGPFVYLGFRPRFLLIKNSSVSVDWVIEDTSRDTYNPVGAELEPNLSNAETTGNNDLDILSNGFKPRRNSTFANGSGNTIIYAAFAENPFKYANAR
jgi:hypothetical protein